MEFYQEKTLPLRTKILGKLLVRKIDGKNLAGRIVEIEAYMGGDPASHAAHGRTKRNSVMFGSGGIAYVYFTYGMHYCFNIVTEGEGFPAAYLVRALEPVHGIDEMKLRRGLDDLRNLTNGPGKLCQAFGIDRELNGTKLDSKKLFLADDGYRVEKGMVVATTRIGIRQGTEKKWRFFLRGNEFVSGANPERKRSGGEGK